MSVWFNNSDALGVIISAMTMNVTGSDFLTYTLLILLAMLFMFVARVPLELQVIMLSPFVIVLGAYSASLVIFAGLVGIYLAFVFIQFLVTRL